VEKGISLGIYPDDSLKQARTRRDAARRLIAEGIDPSAKRKADKRAVAESFDLVTREWGEPCATAGAAQECQAPAPPRMAGVPASQGGGAIQRWSR
jgi:hypothetical protein